jgi:hypothetical protein
MTDRGAPHVRFYVGLDRPGDAERFARACLSINTLRRRGKPIVRPHVLIDSGAFTEIATYGHFRHPVSTYAADLRRLHPIIPHIEAAVTQDYMCEPFMLAKTGLTVKDHQRLTIERYDALVAEALPFPVMPVLQGYDPVEYLDHLRAYGDRLRPGLWVGVGSVCKRNGAPDRIIEVLAPIHAARPDLRLHGFGVKKTALLHSGVRELLFSADSMAWSFAARKQGRDNHDWREAAAFIATVDKASSRAIRPWQIPFLLEGGS